MISYCQRREAKSNRARATGWLSKRYLSKRLQTRIVTQGQVVVNNEQSGLCDRDYVRVKRKITLKSQVKPLVKAKGHYVKLEEKS